MGCDIHQKTFIWSNIENKMVPVMGIFAEDACRVHEIVGNRDYDLFGLFGNSARSNYPELDCFEDSDFPDFMFEHTCGKVTKDDPDAHTRRWCWLDRLKESMLEFERLLHHPKEYAKKYGDDIGFWMPNPNGLTCEKFEQINAGLISSIKWTVGMIDEFKVDINQFAQIYMEPSDPPSSPPVDTTKIALVTWMDS